MIDDSDVDFALLSLPGGSFGWMLIVVSIIVVLMVAAMSNNEECESRRCPEGSVSKLLDHECICVVEARTK